MNTTKHIKLCRAFLVVSIAIIPLLSGCSSFPEQYSTAQANQANQANTAVSNKQAEFRVLQTLGDPCRYTKPDFDITPNENSPDSRLYELVNAGFPNEISLEEAVAVFSKFTQCDERGKSQPSLSVEEVKAAIRDWNCGEEKDVVNKKVCADVWKIAETGRMPKGSFIDFDCGASGMCNVHGYKGYDVDTWEIYLYVWLDKYRRDMKDRPIYSHLIRLNYISSALAQKP